MKKGDLAILPSEIKGIYVGKERNGWLKFYTSKGLRVVQPSKVEWLSKYGDFEEYKDLPPGF